MCLTTLIVTQWQDYGRLHRSRSNLILHLLAVPVFLLANVALLVELLTGHWMLAGICLLTMLVGFAAQGLGHAKETERPVAFTGPWNLLVRTFVEQWITFPRFVLSGGWASAFKASA